MCDSNPNRVEKKSGEQAEVGNDSKSVSDGNDHIGYLAGGGVDRIVCNLGSEMTDIEKSNIE